MGSSAGLRGTFLALFLHALFLFPQPGETEKFHNNSVEGGLKGRKQGDGCNLFRGTWVPDPSYPFYGPSSCPFLEPEFNCMNYGRRDSQFLRYSWKPSSCELPRFDGVEFVNRWGRKKIMLVGDSLSLNMWESLACMIHASFPNTKYKLSRSDPISSVIFQDIGLTLYFYRTPYIVDIVRDPKHGRVLKLDSIRASAGDSWRMMDVLIFNSWHWWLHTGSSRTWDYIQDGSSVARDMNRLIAYYKGMSTWARWVDANIDSSKTKVFFQGISPTHYEGKEWNEPNQNCIGQTQPLPGSEYPAGPPPAVEVVKNVLSSMKNNQVYLLDITLLSQLRKDAHPSAYSGGHPGNDCSHWCLPGVPDTWNQLLYAASLTM